MPEIRMSLKKLIRVALGRDNLTRLNWVILWSIIDVIIKKLRCEDEMIFLDESLAKCIEELRPQVVNNPIKFKPPKEHILHSRIFKLPKLKTYAESLWSRLQIHLQTLYNHDFKYIYDDVIMSAQNTVEGVDLHTNCTRSNDIACFILGDRDFFKKLVRMILGPILNELFILEDKIEELQKGLDEFFKFVYSHLQCVSMLPLILADLNNVKLQINLNNSVFFGCALEIQDFVDRKVSATKWNDFKTGIYEEIREFRKRISVLLTESLCPSPIGVLTDGIKCVMCGNERIKIDIGNFAPPLLPEYKITTNVKSIKLKRKCQQRKYVPEDKDIVYIRGETGYYYRSNS